MIYRFLFPRYSNEPYMSMLLLALRLLFGILFMMHGFDKLNNYAVLSETFPSFMGLGSRVSLLLVMFAELVCSLAFIFGFLFRLAVIPMIIAMLVAFVWAHNGSMAEGELSFIYAMVFLVLAIAGPGRYSVDTPIGDYIMYKDDTHSTKSCGE